MTNIEISDFIGEETHSANIEKIFHLGMQFYSSKLADLLSEIEEDDYRYMLKGVCSTEHLESYIESNEMTQLFFDNNLYGFIAEIHLPAHHDFTFMKTDGSFSSCRCYKGWWSVVYIYAETIRDILDKVKIESDKYFQNDINRALQIKKQ